MPSAQLTFDKVEPANFNTASSIEEVPEVYPGKKEEEEEIYWRPYFGTQGRFVRERVNFSGSFPGIWIYEAPFHTNLATTIEPDTGLIYRTLSAELSPDRIYYRNPELVKAYLTRYPNIGYFIRAAWPALVRCFGGPVDIVLEVVTYPEETANEELVGWIQSTDDIYVGLEKLERFEDEWFLDHLEEVGDRFNFNIETK